MKRTLAYILATLKGPRQGFTLMLFDEQGFAVSLLLLLSVGAGWSLACLGWAVAGLEPWVTPWLSIPLKTYYGWEALMAIPMIFTGWLIASGCAQLLSRQVGGNGSFEATARLLAVAIAVSRLVTVIPALVAAVLASVGALDAQWWREAFQTSGSSAIFVWALVVIEASWLGMLTTVGVRAAHKVRPRRSIGVAVFTVALYYGFTFIALR